MNNYKEKVGKNLVKKSLWRRNYRVADVPNGGLLVEGTHRVEVKVITKDTPVAFDLTQFDTLCVVFVEKFSTHVFYLKNKDDLSNMATDALGVYDIGAKQIKQYFTKKPKEVFKK